jgi:hypothetical protein
VRNYWRTGRHLVFIRYVRYPDGLRLLNGRQEKRRMRSAARTLWRGWKRIAKKIGDFQARLLLEVLYFALLWPFALAVRWRSDPLALKGTTGGWRLRATEQATEMDRALRQF